MSLTPHDVANKQFSQKMRGYAQEEVDGFLDEVEAELTRLLTENAKLTQRLSTAATSAAAAPAAPAPSAAPVAATTETQEAALRTLLMAQRTADQAVAEARAEADALLADAKAKAARTDQELNARISAARARLESEQQGLQNRIEELRAFEREYRMRLKAYLESQLKDLEVRGGGGEGAGAGVPAAARTAAVGVMPSGVTDSGAARPPAPTAPPTPVAPLSAQPAAPPAAPPAPSGPPRQAMSEMPSVGPFRTPPNSAAEQVDEGPEPPSHV